MNVAAADRELVAALLEDGAHQDRELARWLDRSLRDTRQLLHALKTQNVVKQSRFWWSVVDPEVAAAAPEPVPVVPPPPELPPFVTVRESARAPDITLPTNVRVIDGVEYEVVFSGRESLIGEAAGLGSTLSGRECSVSRR